MNRISMMSWPRLTICIILGAYEKPPKVIFCGVKMKAYESVIRKASLNMVDIDATGVIHFANFLAKFEQSQSKKFHFNPKIDDSVCQGKSGQGLGP